MHCIVALFILLTKGLMWKGAGYGSTHDECAIQNGLSVPQFYMHIDDALSFPYTYIDRPRKLQATGYHTQVNITLTLKKIIIAVATGHASFFSTKSGLILVGK